VGGGEVGPAFCQLTVGDAPDYYAGEFDALAGWGIGGAPGIAHDYAIALGDDVLNGHVNVGEAFEGLSEILLGAGGTGRELGGASEPCSW
jgi:hypothetical protein